MAGKIIRPAAWEIPSGYVRPNPPLPLRRWGLAVSRDEEVEALIRCDFVGRGGLFFDIEHAHLQPASIGFLWANSVNKRGGTMKAGTAELVQDRASTWPEAQRLIMLHQLFGRELPDFIITLCGPLCAKMDDRRFFALLDHEVCHCWHARDRYGAPRWNTQTGRPLWAIRPHAYEGFPGTTARWGAVADGSAELVEAATRRPKFAWVPGSLDLDVAALCGNR